MTERLVKNSGVGDASKVYLTANFILTKITQTSNTYVVIFDF